MARRKAEEKVFAVIGLGLFGRQVCATVAERGGTVIAIDNNPDTVERIKETVTQAVLVNATDEDALSQAPLADVDVAVVAMGDNVEASILATALLKRQAVPYVIARAVSSVHAQVLKQIGADEVINVELDAGRRLGSRLIAPQILEQVSLSSDTSVAELHIPASLVGKSLAELDLRARYQVSVISVKRVHVDVDDMGNPVRTEEVVFPDPHERFREDDVIHVVGSNDAIQQFQDL
jgi:trk system potassium uptake protein